MITAIYCNYNYINKLFCERPQLIVFENQTKTNEIYTIECLDILEKYRLLKILFRDKDNNQFDQQIRIIFKRKKSETIVQIIRIFDHEQIHYQKL